MDTTESVTDNDIRQKQYLDALDGTESKLLTGYNIKQILFNECWYCIDVSSKSVFKALIRALLFNPCSINKKINEYISNIDTKKEEKVSKRDTKKMIVEIENEMREAAKNLDFERAMELRDILFELKSE